MVGSEAERTRAAMDSLVAPPVTNVRGCAHFRLDALLHAIVLGDLPLVGVDERARLSDSKLVRSSLKQQPLVECLALLD